MPELEPSEHQHGARVYQVGDRILVKQTVLSGDPPRYVIDGKSERHSARDDDKAIADAVRLALSGQM
jgi:hypothetical protein